MRWRCRVRRHRPHGARRRRRGVVGRLWLPHGRRIHGRGFVTSRENAHFRCKGPRRPRRDAGPWRWTAHTSRGRFRHTRACRRQRRLRVGWRRVIEAYGWPRFRSLVTTPLASAWGRSLARDSLLSAVAPAGLRNLGEGGLAKADGGGGLLLRASSWRQIELGDGLSLAADSQRSGPGVGHGRRPRLPLISWTLNLSRRAFRRCLSGNGLGPLWLRRLGRSEGHLLRHRCWCRSGRINTR